MLYRSSTKIPTATG